MCLRLTLFIICFLIPVDISAGVLLFAGSTRKDSLNKKLINEAAKIVSAKGTPFTIIDLKDYPIPLYDGDLEHESGMPFHAKQIRNLIKQSEVIIISTPSYNGSIPAVLKNTLDWVSRQESGGSGLDVFQGKLFVLMSASPGKKGGAAALVHLKDILQDVGAKVWPHQLSLPRAFDAFDESDNLADPQWKNYLTSFISSVLK